MTAANALKASHHSPYGSILLNASNKIVTACWLKPTLTANDWTQRYLVEPYTPDEHLAHPRLPGRLFESLVGTRNRRLS